ncbi:hypothetical protein RFI_35022 [Reticulomyxa filosa]|uniref:Uncharacterized protein n=1 Tax=Reticulomyxa filosa TaxID=46433 RepID=X6LLE0_RETFI|nr:hypothetical protein RFI_35022 [Reticulomyxa filosa]|eukprot:ETO02414.1 hypothetical protein RFI_35022 [Reticulomyxa filosa]
MYSCMCICIDKTGQLQEISRVLWALCQKKEQECQTPQVTFDLAEYQNECFQRAIFDYISKPSRSQHPKGVITTLLKKPISSDASANANMTAGKMNTYAHETQHKKIICGLVALMHYNFEEKVDPVIQTLIKYLYIHDGVTIRYGGCYTIGLAYAFTANNQDISKLLHLAVSDVSNSYNTNMVPLPLTLTVHVFINTYTITYLHMYMYIYILIIM